LQLALILLSKQIKMLAISFLDDYNHRITEIQDIQMAIEVVMPRQGNTVETCLIVEWRVSIGDQVAKGDVLCEIETDKSTIEVEAEQSGTVLARLFEEGDDVPVLRTMLILGEEGEDVSEFLSDGDTAAKAQAPAGIEPGAVAETEPAPAEVPALSRGKSDFIAISPRARKAAEAAGVEPENLTGSGPSGRILERDVSAYASAHPAVSPAARAAGARSGNTGSGIGGRVRPGEKASVVGSDSPTTSEPGTVSEVKPSGIRKVIASRMMESLGTTAQYTLNASADARSIQAWRSKFKASDESLGLRGITLGDMVVFAASRILSRYPELNAEFKDGVLYQYADVHLGLAVDTPRGLMVPVIRHANRKSLKQISDESKELAYACIEGNISPDALSGATFTLSNLGNFGIESFTPVINAPQVAILGVCAIQPKAVQTPDGVEFLPHMGFSMTIDHQMVDGAPAARFLQEFCSLLAGFEMVAAI
jgi:pyruvate dehydrogenase E2 component (dihydrolipoamide acetyltransferase)